LIGVALGLGLSAEIAAGAIISGAYFGDKMSPLSDTTNLAPAVAGTDLFTHIRHMAWTTGPSFTLALILFTALGLGADLSSDSDSLQALKITLGDAFNITPLALIPLVVVFVMAFRKVPPLRFCGVGVAARDFAGVCRFAGIVAGACDDQGRVAGAGERLLVLYRCT
jgi:NhaC family Na+:H+ antiporter